MRNPSEYAVYKGDTFLCIGTMKECAEQLNLKVDTIKFYNSSVYKKRLDERNANNAMIVIKLD